MGQNNTWMRYLQLGIIISIIAIFNSCVDPSFIRLAEYHFVNETNYAITYPVEYQQHNVAPKSTTIYRERFNVRGKNGADLSDFVSPFSSASLTYKLTIKFDNSKCLINVKENDVNSVKNIKNFIAVKISKDNYKFTYTFTEADYNRAVACP